MLAAADLSTVFLWSLGLLVLLVVGFTVALWLRKRMSPGGADFRAQGFTLADLRDLHKKGLMTDAEFERAKAQVVQGMAAPPPTKAGVTGPDILRPPG
jgi:hypothetical protein